MLRSAQIVLFSLIIIALAPSCDGYNKLLKSNDIDLKREKAKEYYNEGKYYKALPLLDELVSIYRGREELEDIYWIYCNAHYGQGNYLIAAYNFKNFYGFYPNSEKRPDAMYMVGQSYYQLAPPAELEQEDTYKALEAFQLFINSYPESEKVEDANQKMDEMRATLEEKAFNGAKLYFDMDRYRAAAVSLQNMISEFPDTDRSEYAHFLIVKANYLYSKNSIPSKQAERYQETLEAYKTFNALYPESEYQKEATNYFEQATNALKNFANN